MYDVFDPKDAIEKIILHMKNHFSKNNLKEKAIIGISGGKDSSVCAAICVKAFGAENVLGVQMPNSKQADFDEASKIIEILGIKKRVVDIGRAYDAISEAIGSSYFEENNREIFNLAKVDAYKTNTPARLRMTVLYGISAIEGGIVINTCNLSEDVMSFSTLFGDCAGGYAPIQGYTVTEIRAMGRELGLPEWAYNKVPNDGMCGESDESKLGKLLNIPNFSYEMLDRFIRCENCENLSFTNDELKRIEDWYKKGKFKLDIVQIPHYIPKLFNYFSFISSYN